ncbi:MAG: hypothetical protein SFZ02_19315 [bacterium]|nr:hypothetical protein [bacterium]
MKRQRLEVVGQVELLRAYSDSMRKRLINLCMWTVWLSPKGKLAAQYLQIKEHSNWLTMGDKNPNQHLN